MNSAIQPTLRLNRKDFPEIFVQLLVRLFDKR